MKRRRRQQGACRGPHSPQILARRGQGVGAPGERLVPVGPPAGILLAPDLFPRENNSRKFPADSEKRPRTTFLKQKDSRKQELALGILLIG